MSNISSFPNSTLLEVGLPPHMSGVSPTTWLCGNILWKQFLQGQKTVVENKEQNRKRPLSEVEEPKLVVSKQQYSQLHVFACSGQVKATSNILESCSLVEINKQDHNGNTPLIWAAMEGHDDIVQLLVDYRAEINLQNFSGETALFVAASRGHDTVCQILLENGADSNLSNIDGCSALHMAVANGNMSTMMLLSAHGAFVNVQDDNGDTPLHFAVRENNERLVEALVTRCNACADIMNDDDETPLDLASCLECTEIVRFLSKFTKNSEKRENQQEGEDKSLLVQGNFEL